IQRQLTDDYTKSSFYKPLIKESKKLSAQLKTDIENAIKNDLYNSFYKLKNFLVEKYIPCCRDSIGLSAIPGGKEFYDHKLQEYTTTSLNAEEIHDIGLSEVDRIFA